MQHTRINISLARNATAALKKFQFLLKIKLYLNGREMTRIWYNYFLLNLIPFMLN